MVGRHGNQVAGGSREDEPAQPGTRGVAADADGRPPGPHGHDDLHAEDAGCSDEEIEAITWKNACRFFNYDPFAHIPREKATVGALRATATDVDVREVSKVEYRRRWAEAHKVA